MPVSSSSSSTDRTPVTTMAKGEEMKSSSSTTRRVAGVTFSPVVKVFEVKPLDCCIGYERSDYFYTKQDYGRIRSEMKQCLHMMKAGQLEDYEDDTIDHTRRGLEYRTSDGSKKRIQNKEAAWDALFYEQDLQWKNGIEDATTILAKVYRAITKRCGIEAHLRGLQDQSDASKILKETGTTLVDIPLGVTYTKSTGDVVQALDCSPLRENKGVLNFRRNSITALPA